MPSFPTPSSPSVQPVARLNCLSWVCPKIAPPSSWRHRSPLPADPRGSTFGTSLPGLVHVPSSWFPTTSTACSFDAVRVYCNALPTLGFTPFQHRRRESPRGADTSSECLPCPPKPSLRSKQPATSPTCRHVVHRCPCPRALSFPLPETSPRLPARACPVQFRRASRPSSANGSVARPAVARRPRPVLPWACSDLLSPPTANSGMLEEPEGTSKTALPAP